jgi:hypothetical protein
MESTTDTSRLEHIDRATLALDQANAIIELVYSGLEDHTLQGALGGAQELLRRAHVAVCAIRP